MIANSRIGRHLARKASRSPNQPESQSPAVGPGNDIWDTLFQGTLLARQVRLSFHDSAVMDVISIVALDLRPGGWLVIGARTGAQQPTEYHLTSIREVEILAEAAGDCEFEIAMPPMA